METGNVFPLPTRCLMVAHLWWAVNLLIKQKGKRISLGFLSWRGQKESSVLPVWSLLKIFLSGVE